MANINELEWTRNKPCEDGYYWAWFEHSSTKRAQMIFIEYHHGELCIPPENNEAEYVTIDDFSKLLSIIHWMGPLPEPKMPECINHQYLYAEKKAESEKK
jgi:hypothetical protein